MAIEAKSIGNLSPMLLSFAPNLDLRRKFDEMYNARSVEWSGFFPCYKIGQQEVLPSHLSETAY